MLQMERIIDFYQKFFILIVVLTGSEDIDIEEKFRKKYCFDYIIKDGISALTCMQLQFNK